VQNPVSFDTYRGGPSRGRERPKRPAPEFPGFCTKSQPLLLILDDLHWADQPSLLLLEFLVPYLRSSRFLIMGAYRDTDVARQRPLADLLGSLRRERSFEVLSLKGLTVGAVSELLDSYTDQPISMGASELDLAQALWQATEGNPLFIREQLRDVFAGDRLAQTNENRDTAARLPYLGLPEGVRDVISLRLSRLSPSTQSVLSIAAVIGREFDAITLQQASETDDSGMDAALDEAQSARVIEEIARSMARYRFTHALFREAIYADLPARRRRRVHRKVAEALERTCIGDPDAHVSELAYHFGEAQPIPGNERLAYYSLRAGERALNSKAYEEAAKQFQRGLGAKAGQAMDDEQAALLFGLARAQTATLELPRAREVVANLSRAFDFYAQQGDVEHAVAVAECPVDALPGQPVGAARLVAKALALVDRESHAAGRLLSRYARMAAIEEGDYVAAAEACELALAIARRESDCRLEIQTLGNGAEADLNYMRWQEGLAKCMRAIELAEQTDAMHAEMLARFFASIILWSLGDLTRAAEQAATLLARAEQLRDTRWTVSALWIAGTLARYTGDASAALNMTDRGLGLLPADPRLLWTRASLAHDVGDDAIVKSLINRLLDIVPLTRPEPSLAQATTALVLAMVADAGLTGDKLPIAEAAAEAILSFPTATLVVSRVARVSLALIAVRAGDTAAAQRHFPALEPARSTFIYEGMSGDRLLGLLAATMGNHGMAVRHFEAALTFCSNSGCAPELAWTCCDFADVLVARDEPGDCDHAKEFLDRSLTVARGLGMQPLVDRVLVRRERLNEQMTTFAAAAKTKRSQSRR